MQSGELLSALQEDQRLVGIGKRRSRRVVGKWTPWFFLAPALLIYTGFLIYPGVRSFYYSLTSWNGLSKRKFIGLQNYATALTSSSSLSALAHNALWSGVMVTVPTALGLGLAVLLNRPGKVRAFTQGVAFFPGVLSVIGVALVWDWLYDPQSGFVNEVLQKLHLIGSPIDWLGGSIAEIALLVPGIWIAVGLPLVLFLAGLQVIPPELYEAARVDGCATMAALPPRQPARASKHDHRGPRVGHDQLPACVRPHLCHDRRWPGELDPGARDVGVYRHLPIWPDWLWFRPSLALSADLLPGDRTVRPVGDPS